MAFLIVTFIATIAVIVAVILLIMQSAELNKSMEDDISRACILLADEIAEAERHITDLEEVKK